MSSENEIKFTESLKHLEKSVLNCMQVLITANGIEGSNENKEKIDETFFKIKHFIGTELIEFMKNFCESPKYHS